MTERVYTTIDKTTWGDGPWQHEPDKVQWRDEATGLPCLAKRNHFGVWCGYVGVSETHPLYERPFEEPDVEVHDYLTYADHCEDGPEESSICHVPDPGEPDNVWWFGFACGRFNDTHPAIEARAREQGWDTCASAWEDSMYRTLDYCRAHVTSLAGQLAIAVVDNRPVG